MSNSWDKLLNSIIEKNFTQFEPDNTYSKKTLEILFAEKLNGGNEYHVMISKVCLIEERNWLGRFWKSLFGLSDDRSMYESTLIALLVDSIGKKMNIQQNKIYKEIKTSNRADIFLFKNFFLAVATFFFWIFYLLTKKFQIKLILILFYYYYYFKIYFYIIYF